MNAVRVLTITAAMAVALLSVSVPTRAAFECSPSPSMAQIDPVFASPGDRVAGVASSVEENKGTGACAVVAVG